ncbi:MAG: glycoside hydrolase family 3 protein [Tessaracoccus sp.]|uniref:glycoside hydrolase family 3 protein n=1 Tax=Tessaracoccus sp. TaxID=1971211 RepID=UPI001ED03816|nr:glycoside hydrolase family 3 protein [Tessaracoccus sp.]MBK7819915.1 glycoside hydrolase family 3 protein [Tessaracoccus sp.]
MNVERTARVESVLAGLDLTQRVGQLNQRLLGWRAVERGPRGWRLTEEGLREIERWSGLGAIYGLLRADAWSGRSWANGVTPDDRREVIALVQEAVRDASPESIGALVVEEAPHGHQALGGTILPQNLAVGATWDPDLFEEACAAVAAELAASGVDVALVSGLDILRHPSWGRSEECFGEDPLLAAELVRAAVRGMQGRDDERLGQGGVGVVLKHLAAQGEAVGGRNGQSAVIGPRDLHEIHLPAAAAGVEAGAVGVMAAYNDIDGVPCCANSWLLTTWLREERGFAGIVMADGVAVDQLRPLAGSIPAAGRAALLAGVDLSLWDEGFTTLVGSAERSEQVFDAVTTAARRVLTLKDRLGLLPRMPEQDVDDRERIEARGDLGASFAATAELSRRLAAQALVPLSGSLPAARLLVPSARVAVIGGGADDLDCFLGDYVAPLRPGAHRTVLGELQARLPGVVRAISPTDDDADAVLAAADVVVAVLGGTSRRSYADEFDVNGAALGTAADCGEGVDLADVSLPGRQDEMMARVRDATSAHVVSVIVAGRPHVLSGVLASSDSAIWAGYAGPYGPATVVDALLGEAIPAGRLPFTLPSTPMATPVRYNDRWSAARVYRDAPEPVLLSFGHGATADGWVATMEHHGEVARVAVAVPDGPGDTVVPVFVRRRGGDALPRLLELVAFTRVPNGTTATFVLSHDRLLPPGTGERGADVIVGGRVIGTLDDSVAR